MFPNARNTVVNGGTFTMQGDFHLHQVVDDGRKLMALLQQHIAPGAFHNSHERYDPPKCHPHTRRAVLKKITDWVKDPNKVALFLWLYGPAGAGKSAIAQTIAELLEKAGLLAAAFFFSRHAAGRSDKTSLVATLVYQFVKSIPEIQAHVLKAVEGDPALFSCSIEAQIEALIVKPLNAVADDETLAPTLLSRPRLVILDGLDECRTTSSQTQILHALSTAVKHLHIPLCFLIASRPEQQIRQAFNDRNHRLCRLSFSVALDDTYQPDDDIRVFLRSTFDEIKRQHPSRAYLPASWPSSEDIRWLVKKSSGQFIFASTVAKYVNSHRHWPPDRLKIILGKSNPGQETPFAELDSLYHFILSSVANIEKVMDVLAFLILHPLENERAKTTIMCERFLFYRPGEIHMILSDIHSIIFVPAPKYPYERLEFFHASLSDFLLDRSRSTDLFLDQGVAYAKFTNLALKHINNPTESPPGKFQLDVHHAFSFCCVKTRPSPKLLEDLCRVNLTVCMNSTSVAVPELMCWFGRQQLSPDSTETLLDRHLATFDGWLRARFMSSPGHESQSWPCFLAVVTLLDQLDPKEYNWKQLPVILQGPFPFIPFILNGLFDGTDSDVEFSRIVSKFFMDRDRAGTLWVNPHVYVNLATQLLKILHDKYVVDIHARIQFPKDLKNYCEVGKLALNLLAILLPRIKALGGSQVHEVKALLRSCPALYLMKNDPLGLEKVKAAQAIEEFLKKERSVFMQRFMSTLLPWLG